MASIQIAPAIVTTHVRMSAEDYLTRIGKAPAL